MALKLKVKAFSIFLLLASLLLENCCDSAAISKGNNIAAVKAAIAPLSYTDFNYGDLGDLSNYVGLGELGNYFDLGNYGDLDALVDLVDLGDLGNYGDLGDLDGYGMCDMPAPPFVRKSNPSAEPISSDPAIIDQRLLSKPALTDSDLETSVLVTTIDNAKTERTNIDNIKPKAVAPNAEVSVDGANIDVVKGGESLNGATPKSTPAIDAGPVAQGSIDSATTISDPAKDAEPNAEGTLKSDPVMDTEPVAEGSVSDSAVVVIVPPNQNGVLENEGVAESKGQILVQEPIGSVSNKNTAGKRRNKLLKSSGKRGNANAATIKEP